MGVELSTTPDSGSGRMLSGPTVEAEQWVRPSPRLLHMRVTEVAVLVTLLGTLATILAGMHGAIAAGIAGGTSVLLLALGLLMAVRRSRSWGYLERASDLLVRRGVLVEKLTIVPYGRMQIVDVTAGAIERAFGLATIQLHTASASTDARIPGLTPDEATRLRDQLAAFGEAQAAGV
jgi:membrane protein YdbS with pleckstrin-like domain